MLYKLDRLLVPVRVFLRDIPERLHGHGWAVLNAVRLGLVAAVAVSVMASAWAVAGGFLILAVYAHFPMLEEGEDK